MSIVSAKSTSNDLLFFYFFFFSTFFLFILFYCADELFSSFPLVVKQKAFTSLLLFVHYKKDICMFRNSFRAIALREWIMKQKQETKHTKKKKNGEEQTERNKCVSKFFIGKWFNKTKFIFNFRISKITETTTTNIIYTHFFNVQ